MKLLNVYLASGKLENGNNWENYYLQVAETVERHSENFNEFFPSKYRIIDIKISKRIWEQLCKEDPTLLINKDITIYYDSKQRPNAVIVK